MAAYLFAGLIDPARGMTPAATDTASSGYTVGIVDGVKPHDSKTGIRINHRAARLEFSIGGCRCQTLVTPDRVRSMPGE